MAKTSQFRTYDTAASVVFLKTRELFGGLSNMAPGFPLQVNGIRIRTSEALYQACRYPHRPDLQRRIIDERSPMTAKMRSKPYRHDSRRDWNQVRVNVMRWCLRVKLAQNWDIFSKLLLDTGEQSIVERSRKDDFWGAKPVDERTLVGMNVLGRLLMELREAVKSEPRENFLRVDPLPIEDFLLGGYPIKPVAVRTFTRAETVDGTRAQPRRPRKPESIGVQLPLTRRPNVSAYPSSADTTDWARDGGIGHLKPYPAYRLSGDECLGKVPGHWEVRTLAQIGKLSKGCGGNKDDEVADGVPCVRYGDLYTTHDYFIQKSRSFVSRGKAPEYTTIRFGDVLFAGSGETIDEIGKSAVNLMQTEACCGGDVIVFRPARQVDARYLGYATDCRPAVVQKATMGRGITVMHIYGTRLKRLTLPLPPLCEQTAIVRCLDYADRRIRRYIRAKQKLIKLLAEEREAATHDAQRLPGSRSLRIGSAADRVERPISRQGDHFYTPIGLYNRGRGIFHKPRTRGSDLGDSTFFWLAEGDLVLSGQFAWEGAVALAGEEDDGCVASHRYPVLRGKPDLVESAYLLSFFRTGWGQLLLDHHSRGAAGRNRPLNAATLIKERVPVPPLPVQKQIGALVRREYRLRQALAEQTTLLREYRTRLIADVVTGKLDVRKAAARLSDEAEETELIDGAEALINGGEDLAEVED